MKVKSINKKPVVIYEVAGEIKMKSPDKIDVSATMIQDLSTESHSEQFKDFIESFGFKISDEHLFREQETVTIDGVEFILNYEKTSLLSKNAYVRQYRQRADRCIEILRDRFPDKILAKIKFNVELDRDAIIKKIKKRIAEAKEIQQKRADQKSKEQAELEKMRNHYFSNEGIASFVNSMTIQKGQIHMHTDEGTVYVDAGTGEFISFVPEETSSMNMTDIVGWGDKCKNVAKKIVALNYELKKLGAVGETFTEFAKEAYHRTVTKEEVEQD